MDYQNYFTTPGGLGILCTSALNGQPNAAVYRKPQVTDDGLFIFEMLEKSTFVNIKENPHALFMFIEDKEGYRGKRFSLKMISEEAEEERVAKIKAKHPEIFAEDSKTRHCVCFEVLMVRPLVGGKEGDRT